MSQQTKNENQKDLATLHEQLFKDCERMACFALETGKQVSPSILRVLEKHRQNLPTDSITQELRVGELTRVHNQLARIIAPANPRTLLKEEDYFLKRFKIPSIVGWLFIWVLIFLIIFIGTSLSEQVNATNLKTENFSTLAGFPLLIIELFLLSAAGLGASFAALFKINRFIARHTFDSKHTTSYWIQIVLGVIAGLFISQLVQLDLTAGDVDVLSKPTLALLGGFSSVVVYRILKQFLTALEAFVQGNTEDILETQRQLLHTNAQQMIQEERLHVVADLVKLKEKLGKASEDENIHTLLDDMVAQLFENGR